VWRDAPPDRRGGWTPDPVRGRYFRHRHADHEPDLNGASHAVRDALLDVLRFWFDLGLDGVALDCDEPAFPAAARAVLDAEFPDRLLVTCDHHDADQPDPAAPGGGCQMAVHAVAQAPALPAGCQWGISLRDRGTAVRRRLASTLDNDHRQVRLCTALLLSLPGSPVLYYGDEIGMGDNVWLGDGDATPTPMQWSSDRNAGFSRCDPNRIYLPAVADPVYGYQAVNVAAQDGEEASLLHWVRRMLAVRRAHPAFGVGGFTELDSSNPSVLAYLRRDAAGEPAGDPVLCVYNLSRVPQPVELDLSAYEGHLPVELTGQVRFPRIGRLTYLLTLPGHGFYWFVLAAARS
jgi:maltose alpha-D-glucosyltransferase/alpha-amylase